MAVTRVFIRMSVTDPSVTGQPNSIPTKFLLSAPKEVFTSKMKGKTWKNLGSWQEIEDDEKNFVNTLCSS